MKQYHNARVWTHKHHITVAAMWAAAVNVERQRKVRRARALQSLSRPNMRSMMFRVL